ncbi:MAG: tetratricopeptide repeat protein, partial [Tepidiformaceae bacterium]
MFRANLTNRRTRLALGAGAIVIAGAAFAPGILRSYGPWAEDGGDSSPFVSVNTGDPSATQGAITELEQAAQDSDDPAVHLALANAYLQRVRETSDPSLYAAAESALDRAAELAPDDPEVTFVRGTLALARHDFEGAFELGKRAVAADPERARYHGLLADAQLELGLYADAVESLQQMVDRRPDFASFSRVAYARELHGDTEGAIQAMEAAIEAEAPYAENIAWAYVQVGNLKFALGDLDGAEVAYQLAAERLEGYAGALAGRGRLAAARGDFETAADLYQQAFDRQPLAEYAIALGDIALRQGDTEAARRADEL